MYMYSVSNKRPNNLTSLRNGTFMPPNCVLSFSITSEGPASSEVPVSAIALQFLQ